MLRRNKRKSIKLKDFAIHIKDEYFSNNLLSYETIEDYADFLIIKCNNLLNYMTVSNDICIEVDSIVLYMILQQLKIHSVDVSKLSDECKILYDSIP